MDMPLETQTQAPLVDAFGRTITYLRLSVTDRCDFRCVYCMSEHMTFLPKKDLLTLEELSRLCSAFMARGVRKIRLSGGEPLVRRGLLSFIEGLGAEVGSGLDEITLTTNGSQLGRFADDLYAAGVRRINVSLDTLDDAKFKDITRWGRLPQVLAGIDAALAAGLAVKINTVAVRGFNDTEIPSLIAWAHGREMDLTLIETMPMGDIEDDRFGQYLPLSDLRQTLEQHWTLTDLPDQTGGPARYVRAEQTGGRIGFITPLTHNFCESCNRIRVTCTGELYTCLGQPGSIDLRNPLRLSDDNALLHTAIDTAIADKPKGHDFRIQDGKMIGAMDRHMSVTGG